MTPFFDRLAELERTHTSFAVATVVARQSPVSSHLGDRALIFADGRMEGFVGGSCSRDIVRRQGLAAIRSGRSVLLEIRPEASLEDRANGQNAERVVIPMGCSSEGAVDVYIEPHIPMRSLVVIGFTPVADALARLASSLEYKVGRVVAEDERRDVEAVPGVEVLSVEEFPAYLARLDVHARARLVAIVASQGHYDEIALEALLGVHVAFVGLLASRRRAATVLGVLAQQGLAAERLATIRNPVGLDIGARSPGEVAVSILAEIIGATPAATEAEVSAAEPSPVAVAVDPVCGMDVEVATSRHHLTHLGRMFYFCCAGCRTSFAGDPARYLTGAGAT